MVEMGFETGDVELGGGPVLSIVAGELAFLGSIDGAAEAIFHATADSTASQGRQVCMFGVARRATS